jgi:hypothetical protein
MIRRQDRYQHLHWHHVVAVTDLQGTWVEFVREDTLELSWLEISVFEQAYTLKDRLAHWPDAWGDLALARASARDRGLLVPKEFLPR